jgi:hypothetical protein
VQPQEAHGVYFRERWLEPALDVDAGQLTMLGKYIASQLAALARGIRRFRISSRAHRKILAMSALGVGPR